LRALAFSVHSTATGQETDMEVTCTISPRHAWLKAPPADRKESSGTWNAEHEAAAINRPLLAVNNRASLGYIRLGESLDASQILGNSEVGSAKRGFSARSNPNSGEPREPPRGAFKATGVFCAIEANFEPSGPTKNRAIKANRGFDANSSNTVGMLRRKTAQSKPIEGRPWFGEFLAVWARAERRRMGWGWSDGSAGEFEGRAGPCSGPALPESTADGRQATNPITYSQHPEREVKIVPAKTQ
jgi:hypothetical protein